MNPLDIIGIIFVSLLLYSFIFSNILINNRLKPRKEKAEKIKNKITISFSTILIIALILLLIAINVIVFVFLKPIYIAILIAIELTIILSVLKYHFKDEFKLYDNPAPTIILEIIQNLVFIGLGIFLFITLQANFNNILLALFICLGFIILSWTSWLITLKGLDCGPYDFIYFLIPVITSAVAIILFIVSLFILWSVDIMVCILVGIMIVVGLFYFGIMGC